MDDSLFAKLLQPKDNEVSYGL